MFPNNLLVMSLDRSLSFIGKKTNIIFSTKPNSVPIVVAIGMIKPKQRKSSTKNTNQKRINFADWRRNTQLKMKFLIRLDIRQRLRVHGEIFVTSLTFYMFSDFNLPALN